jgi:hypothetical protein
VAAADGQYEAETSDILRILLQLLMSQNLEEPETTIVLHALATCTAHDDARQARYEVLSSAHFLNLLALLHNASLTIASALIVLLENLTEDKSLLPHGPRDVVIASIVSRINATTGHMREWSVQEEDFFVRMWAVLYSLMIEGTDTQAAATYLEVDQLNVFVHQRRFGLQRALWIYIRPIVREGKRHDRDFKNAAARRIQWAWTSKSHMTPHAIQRARLALLQAYMYGMLQLEEDWYQGVKTMKRRYLLKFQ